MIGTELDITSKLSKDNNNNEENETAQSKVDNVE